MIMVDPRTSFVLRKSHSGMNTNEARHVVDGLLHALYCGRGAGGGSVTDHCHGLS